eukprot:CAMPEP_0178770142 /NCGR_PEP_ID=MMETSP0744-20121128/21221_1 /TAXON_ID=913974 /ORGANISM="Nitzschia punctata, Strain CCMP561" /LENGTH=274 /DNA_ID=CAMNT_0020426473 /DNA_START=347 /DNA_END=1168 /DNA_ORIENTATION=+
MVSPDGVMFEFPSFTSQKEDKGSSGGDLHRFVESLKSRLPVEYHSRILSSAKSAVKPVWGCKADNINVSPPVDKFIFVHVFKTAGSTMRSFFDHYATLCPSKSYATLTSCTSIEPSSLNTSIWKPCVLKYDRKDGERHNLKQTPVPKENLHSYDMIGGHFRIGLMDHLDDTGSVNPRNRHLVFVRNAAMKYISGKVYIRTKAQRNLTSYDIICEIEEEIKGMIQSQEHHMKYTNYLLTPTQARQRQKESWSYQQRAQVVMQNLIDYNCTIGVVE